MRASAFFPLLLAALLTACSTSSGLVDHGFEAKTIGENEWMVRFEGESMSQERARDNLLYHSARHVLDHGGTYFRFDETDATSRFASESTESVSEEPSLGNPAGETYESGISLERVVTISAIVRIVSDPAEADLDASRLLEDLTRKYGR